ncbi:hypothetical protein CDAR_170491 [Caerostris darwini]|uniref:Uncharacterized protein n=1 Tax=Caerostris darwini TaxID=1538125 RepID=A0AAV4R4V6_9ARAC|nr:hypothetical protein CDAR_170491 [Caerostris darwini]
MPADAYGVDNSKVQRGHKRELNTKTREPFEVSERFIDDNGTQYKPFRDLSWLQSTNSQVNGHSIAPEVVSPPRNERKEYCSRINHSFSLVNPWVDQMTLSP